MRDDLHKSVPQRTAWARVLRLACQHAAQDELLDAMVRAIRKDARWLSAPWGKQFEATLDIGATDMFSHEKVREELLALAVSSPDTNARASCEMALGCLARDDGVALNLKGIVIDAAMRAIAGDCIELVASRVAAKFDQRQAAQVRRLLHELLPQCDLSRDPPRRTRRPDDLSIESALDLPLALLTQ